MDFTLPDLEGKNHKLSDYRGKWVVVNYWATWCPPCLKEIPDLIEFHEAHKTKDAVVIGVDFEDIAVKELTEFVDEYFIDYTVLRQKPAARSDLGLISGLPTSFLISPEGELIARQTGPVSAKMIEDFIKKQTTTKVDSGAKP
jgi:thiol-disulfide isomerase/thioredoxin